MTSVPTEERKLMNKKIAEMLNAMYDEWKKK